MILHSVLRNCPTAGPDDEYAEDSVVITSRQRGYQTHAKVRPSYLSICEANFTPECFIIGHLDARNQVCCTVKVIGPLGYLDTSTCQSLQVRDNFPLNTLQ